MCVRECIILWVARLSLYSLISGPSLVQSSRNWVWPNRPSYLLVPKFLLVPSWPFGLTELSSHFDRDIFFLSWLVSILIGPFNHHNWAWWPVLHWALSLIWAGTTLQVLSFEQEQTHSSRYNMHLNIGLWRLKQYMQNVNLAIFIMLKNLYQIH